MTASDLPVILTRPRHWANGVIFGSPHSGRCYPEWFLAETSLPMPLLRSSEDAFVDQMIAAAPDCGAVTICAQVPRCIVDLNRSPDEIDPQVVRGTPRHPLNQRTLAGLGVIPRVVSHGRQILNRPIDRAEADRRLNAYWHPYHQALAALIAEARARFGHAVLIDMHSMPRESLSHLHGQRPEMVLGNRHGLSAAARVTDAVIDAIEAEGWVLRRNSPFSGAYIAQAYGRPAQNIHVLQLEIDRSLYLDEAVIEPRPDFPDFVQRMGRLVRKLSALDAGSGTGRRIAAE